MTKVAIDKLDVKIRENLAIANKRIREYEKKKVSKNNGRKTSQSYK